MLKKNLCILHEQVFLLLLIGLKALQRKDRILTQPAAEVTSSFVVLKVQALYQRGTKSSLNSALGLIEAECVGEVPSDVLLLKGNILVKLGDTETAKVRNMFLKNIDTSFTNFLERAK